MEIGGVTHGRGVPYAWGSPRSWCRLRSLSVTDSSVHEIIN